MSGKQQVAEEDLAIQDTLSMAVQERLELLATLIADKIAEDQRAGHPLLVRIAEYPNG